MSVGMIAVSRCITLTRPELGNRLFTGCNGKIAILSIWIYANLMVVPMYFPALSFGTFGYNCKVGKCDFISLNEVLYPRVILYGIGFTIPCILTTISYSIIWWYIFSTNR